MRKVEISIKHVQLEKKLKFLFYQKFSFFHYMLKNKLSEVGLYAEVVEKAIFKNIHLFLTYLALSINVILIPNRKALSSIMKILNVKFICNRCKTDCNVNSVI